MDSREVMDTEEDTVAETILGAEQQVITDNQEYYEVSILNIIFANSQIKQLYQFINR